MTLSNRLLHLCRYNKKFAGSLHSAFWIVAVAVTAHKFRVDWPVVNEQCLDSEFRDTIFTQSDAFTNDWPQ